MSFSIGELFFEIRARKDKFVTDLRTAQEETRRSGTVIERTNKRLEESFGRVNDRLSSVTRVMSGMARFVGVFGAIAGAALAAAKAIDELVNRSQTLAMERSDRAITVNEFLSTDRSRRESARIANIADPVARFEMEQRMRLQDRLVELGKQEDKESIKGILGVPAGVVDFFESAGRNLAGLAFRTSPLGQRAADRITSAPLFSERQRERIQESFQQGREQLIDLNRQSQDQELLALFRQLLEGFQQQFNQQQGEALLQQLGEIRAEIQRLNSGG